MFQHGAGLVLACLFGVLLVALLFGVGHMLLALSPLVLLGGGAGLLLLLAVGLWAWLSVRRKSQPQGLGTVVVHVSNNASVTGSGNSQNTWR